VSALYIAVALVAAQRLAELVWARRNLRRLRARGGIESGARHYPLIVALHAAWLAAMLAFIPADAPANWALLALYAALQPLRYWAIASLGEYWTTRVIVVPGAAAVRRGPYRFLNHPNYIVVAIEIALFPAAFGAWMMAAIFGVLNLALLAHRISVERAARAV
jgi:methyltransferase